MADGEEPATSKSRPDRSIAMFALVSVEITINSAIRRFGDSAKWRSGPPYFNQPPTSAIFTDL
jgi:hypothetical protein